MKYMITWKIPPGSHKPAAEAFLASGAPNPAGVTTIGRWHLPGSARGWHLVESEDGPALAQGIAEWADVCELELLPVIEDAEAASGLSKIYGSEE